MSRTEIKKALYKQKPIAEFQYIRKGVAHYRATIDIELPFNQAIFFEIPVDDMGDADFTREMDAKLLNRWIMIEEEV